MIFDIIRNSFVDGPGIRTTVFFKGCNLRCVWCHNPEGQAFGRQRMFFKSKCQRCGKCTAACQTRMEEPCVLCGRCAAVCPHDACKISGIEATVDEIFAEVLPDKPFYDASGGGVTFSGGECMLQPDLLRDCLVRSKAEGLHTAVDTAGAVPWEAFEAVLPYTDLFLYDIKAIDPVLHKECTGVKNERILSNYARLLENGARIWVRVPVIPGRNDGAEQERIRAYLAAHAPERIDYLPEHRLGEGKRDALAEAVIPALMTSSPKFNR